jgi:hypothetical protein
MSFERFPNKQIPFAKLLDGCLKRFGISTDVDDSTGMLIAPDGTATVVRNDDNGNAMFPGKMPMSVHHAVAKVFNVDSFPIIQRSNVVIKGPGHDPQLISNVLGAASECDQLLDAFLEDAGDFLDLGEHVDDYELVYCVNFGRTALELVRRGLNRGVFRLNLNSFFGQEFAVMVGIGFFMRVDDHYQMVVPLERSIEAIINALMQLLETQDAQYFLHPERYLVTMSKHKAKSLCKSLRKNLSARSEPIELAPAVQEALRLFPLVLDGSSTELG